jgi:hypothetical protein
MNVTPIRPTGAQASRKSVPPDVVDTACVQSLVVCATHNHIVASWLLETGRVDQSKKLSELAAKVDGIGKQLKPPSPPGNANEAAGGR